MWHSKTMIQSGVNVNKLKNLNQASTDLIINIYLTFILIAILLQSAVKQTENILKANKEKVVKKTQLKREEYNILGKVRQVLL